MLMYNIDFSEIIRRVSFCGMLVKQKLNFCTHTGIYEAINFMCTLQCVFVLTQVNGVSVVVCIAASGSYL